MAHFKEKDILPFRDERGTVLIMGKLIGTGNQADVHMARDAISDEIVAAKYCYGDYSNNKPLFYEKVKTLANYPPPHPDLCWPTHVSRLTSGGTFVYTMPLLTGYHSLASVIKNEVKLTIQQKAIILRKAGEILRRLHNERYVYGDISERNIMYRIEPNGEISVKFIDCENVTVPGFSLGLMGSGKFRAPELLLPLPGSDPDHPEYAPPSIQSDIHAFAVLAFRMLLRRHPLDGIRARTVSADDPEGFLEHYARHPLFIFDGEDNSPGPKVKRKWDMLPEYMQDYFRDVFSQRCLHSRAPRLDMEVFLHILSLSFHL